MLQVCAHTVSTSGSIARMILDGDVAETEVQKMLAFLEPLAGRESHWGIIADVRRLNSIEASARRYGAQWSRRFPNFATAAVGAGTTTRVLIGMIARANQLFMRRPIHLRFFQTEADALVWLQQHLAQRRTAG